MMPMMLCVMNGLFGKIVDNITASSLFSATLSTFGISVIVWAALYFGCSLLANAEYREPKLSDWILGGSGYLLALLPWGVASWIGVALIGARLISVSSAGSYTRRGAWILVSVTVPVLWSKALFSAFAPIILAIDASLVSAVLQTPRDGNLVAIPGGGGQLQVAAACSSLANTSLVIPLWTTMTQIAKLPFRAGRMKWPILAGVMAIFINVLRISLIGWFPAYYDLIHGEYGQFVVSYLILGTTYWVCRRGIYGETALYPHV